MMTADGSPARCSESGRAWAWDSRRRRKSFPDQDFKKSMISEKTGLLAGRI